MEIKVEQVSKKNWERIILYGVCILLLLFGLKGCFDTSKLEGKMEEQKKEIITLKKEFKDEKAKFIIVQDSLKKDAEKKQDSINQLHKENKVLENNIAVYKEENRKQKEQLVNWDKKHQVSFLKAYYKTKDVIETPTGIELQKDIPIKVIGTIYDNEMFKNQLKDQEGIIYNKDKEIDLQKGLTLNEKTEKDKALSLLSDSEKIVGEQDGYMKNADKTISRLKTQKLFTTIALPVAIVVTAITTILIVK